MTLRLYASLQYSHCCLVLIRAGMKWQSPFLRSSSFSFVLGAICFDCFAVSVTRLIKENQGKILLTKLLQLLHPFSYKFSTFFQLNLTFLLLPTSIQNKLKIFRTAYISHGILAVFGKDQLLVEHARHMIFTLGIKRISDLFRHQCQRYILDCLIFSIDYTFVSALLQFDLLKFLLLELLCFFVV